MENSNTCIVSVAFREPYLTHSKRQEEALRRHSGFDLLYFRNQLPTRNGVMSGTESEIVSEFQKSLYGFKPWALNEALAADYDKLIWLDPAVLPTAPIKILIDELDSYPMLVVRGEHKLKDMCNKRSKDWFRFDDNEETKHIGGTIYAMNMLHPIVEDIFITWMAAESSGLFGTQDDHMKGHWADESCMAMAMCQNEMPQYPIPEEFTYLNQKNL